MASRPNITIQPGQVNDVFELLNAQQGWDNVPVGTALFIQNKGSVPIFVHETAGEPTSFVCSLEQTKQIMNHFSPPEQLTQE